MTDSITVFSDYVCPFCYLGRRSLADYQDSRVTPLEIDWHPFDLRANRRDDGGEVVVEGGHDDEYYERARRNVERLREAFGATEMVVDRPLDVDSLDAQVASHALRERTDYETWLAFDEAVFAAHWEDERDVGDVDVLADLAETAGIDGTTVREAVADDAARAAVSEAFDEARRAGVTGVPTFAYDGRAARGAVSPDRLERLVEGEQ